MKKIIGNTILNTQEIDRVEIVKKKEGIIFPLVKYDVDVYIKKTLPRLDYSEPQNYDYILVTVDSFKGPGAKEDAQAFLRLINQIIKTENIKGSDEE